MYASKPAGCELVGTEGRNSGVAVASLRPVHDHVAASGMRLNLGRVDAGIQPIIMLLHIDTMTTITVLSPCTHPPRTAPHLAVGPRSTEPKVPSAFRHPGNDRNDDRRLYMHTPNTGPEPWTHPPRTKTRLPARPRSTEPKVPSAFRHPGNGRNHVLCPLHAHKQHRV